MRLSLAWLSLATLAVASVTVPSATRDAQGVRYYSDCYCRFGYPAPYSCEPEVFCKSEGGKCAGSCSASAQSK